MLIGLTRREGKGGILPDPDLFGGAGFLTSDRFCAFQVQSRNFRGRSKKNGSFVCFSVEIGFSLDEPVC